VSAVCRVLSQVLVQFRSWTFAVARTSGATSVCRHPVDYMSLQTRSLGIVSRGEKVANQLASMSPCLF